IGTYFVIIEDEVSKCQVIQTVVIADEGSVMVVVPTSNPGCGSITVNVDIQDGTYVGTSGFNYTLTNIADGTLTSGNVLAEPFDTSPVPPGNYTLQLEDIASTCIQLTGPFAVTESPQATLSVTTDECAVPVTITASSNAANAQFTWTGPGGFSATGKTVNPSVTGDYIVTIDDLSGATCPNTLTENVVVNNFTPEIILTGDPCSGQLMLEASPATGNYSYLWSGPQTGGQLLLVTSATSGTYNLKVRDQNTGCVRDAAPVDAFTVDPVSVSLSSTLACDDGNPFTLTATAEPVGVDLKWYKDGGLVSDSTNTTFSSIPGGLFRVEASSQAGEVVCSDAAEMLITLAPYSKPDLPNRVAICDDPDNPDPATSEITFDPGSIFVDFLWKQDGLEVSTDQIYTASQAALYTVDLLNAYGCPAADTVEVVRECDPILNIPNAFSPNGNGQNEEFFIYTIFVADEFEVSVFNRWGELVFLSNDKDFRWNGGYNNDIGNPLPGGTYVYVMKYSSIYQLERGVQELRGGVVLLR
ncbi:MAG: gliding motility-associated C-terminal domain-containing protein, partial [Cyclobacteriaceae bacterium]|nr:gliding motility-associated C-terminal domain-containing protein [Cyclobacteriaceae bacterium]